MEDEQYINIEDGLSVGAVKIADKYEILTEEEIHNIDDKIPELDERVSIIEENINNKVPELDERVGIIEDEIEEINSSLDKNKKEMNDKINKVYSDKRIFKHVFGHCVDWSFRGGNGGNWTEERIITEINSLKSFGVEEISCTIQPMCRDGILTLVSNLELFKKCLDYANSLGIKTSMIKIHCNEFRKELNATTDKTNLFSQWYSLVNNVGDYFINYCDYFVPINEGEHIFKEPQYETFLLECLRIGQSKGFKCGFTPSSSTQWDSLPQTVKVQCDFIAFNCYPTVGLKGLNTPCEDVVNAFENYNLNNWINEHKEEYDKPIFITEIGIDDRVSNFASTFVWDFGNGEEYNNGEVQKIMLKGIFETLKDNKNLDKFYYWFPFRGNAVKEVINYYVGGAINE